MGIKQTIENSNKENAKILRLDCLTFVFIMALTLAVLDSYFRFASYIIYGDVVSDLFCIMAGLLCVLIVLFCSLRKIEIYIPKIEKWDVIYLGIFAVFMLNKISFPDSMYDTKLSEIFIQKFIFTNKLEILKPYLPIYSAWYGLSGRLFYYARLILGYRLSIIINYFVIIISYYKIKELLIYFINPSQKKVINKYKIPTGFSIIPAIAFMILFEEFLIIGSYIIKSDLFAIPLFLECFRIVFCEKELNTGHYVLSGFFIGVSSSIKLSNVTFFFPLIIWIIIREIKNKRINVKNIIGASVFAVIPILPFALYGILFTGSPIYPFYNRYLKSPYFPPANFIDFRWGPSTFIETVLWPIIIVFDTSRCGEIISGSPISNGRLAIGCIVALISFFFYKKKNMLQRRLPIILCFLFAVLSWSATTGYVRYAITINVFSFLYLAIFIFDLLQYDKRYTSGLLTAFACVSLIISLGFVTVKNYDWSWRPSIATWPIKDYISLAKQNIALLGQDRFATRDLELQKKFNSVDTWVCLTENTANATLANPDANFLITDWSGPGDKRLVTENYFSKYGDDDLFALEDYISQDILDIYALYGLVAVEKEEVYIDTIDVTRPAIFIRLMRIERAEDEGVKPLELTQLP